MVAPFSAVKSSMVHITLQTQAGAMAAGAMSAAPRRRWPRWASRSISPGRSKVRLVAAVGGGIHHWSV